MESKKRVLSCIQPTNQMHLGNYFGAVANWVRLQEEGNYDCIYGVVDLHAMTMPYNPKELQDKTWSMVLAAMACGIDPDKSTLFIQSLVPQHTELAWMLNCTTSYGQLSRMTQFKDKSTQLGENSNEAFVSTGLFTYPILQAADIMIYQADYVPVGKDQQQHLELTRNIAQRFNNQFGDYFKEPDALFTKISKVLSTADPSKKMSKSLGPKHYIGIFDDEKVIRKKIRSAVTDSGTPVEGQISPGVQNLFGMLEACNKNEVAEKFKTDYLNGNIRYGDLKNEVADVIVDLTNGFKSRKADLESNMDETKKQVLQMSERARDIASDTMKGARKKAGLPNY